LDEPSKRRLEPPVRPELRGLRGYVPIVPFARLAELAGVPVERVVKLDGNENPYGCSPRAKAALERYDQAHIYPDPDCARLRAALAAYAGVPAGQIVVSAGSDELIELATRAFLSPGDSAVICEPTFGMYRFQTEIAGAAIRNVPRADDYRADVAAIGRAIDARTKIIWLDSPNNPSGVATAVEDVLTLLGLGPLVVVDEAYFEFSGRTAAALLGEHENLLVLRTFSKWAGLAGLRVGYGLMSVQLASLFMQIKVPYTVNGAAQDAALASLEDAAYRQRVVGTIVAERERLAVLLEQTGIVGVVRPSSANFLLCRVLKGRAKEIHAALQHQAIFVRYFNAPSVENCLRISVGKPEHTDALIAALKKVVPE